ncbi:hypothetical protein [Streptomyces sp. NBC_00316]|uniref:hypothetical protein n=1 Tax=Streptomyces sp. NBC_00316 TaxID=2975710 RepID=UPI003FA7DE71
MSRPVTIVTGGSRGIRAATCLRLAADGHDLALGHVANEAAAEETATPVRAAPAGTAVIDTSNRSVADTAAHLISVWLGSTVLQP